MKKTTISLTKEEMEYFKILLFNDALRLRKKLDEDIDKNDKAAILFDFKNSITNYSIKTKIFCEKER